MLQSREVSLPRNDSMTPPEQISSLLQVFNTAFTHILPKHGPFVPPRARPPAVKPKVCMELVEQFEITLQLLVQNIILSPDFRLKDLSLRIFLELVSKKNQLLERLFLPGYSINLNDFVNLAQKEIRWS